MDNRPTLLEKRSFISIGLAIVLAIWIFWSGVNLGQIKSELEHQRQDMEKFVPRSELETRMGAIEKYLDEIKGTQKEILKELRDDGK